MAARSRARRARAARARLHSANGVLARALTGFALLASAAAGVVAQEPEPSASPPPRIHLIATGGTISNTDDDGRLTGEQIAAAVDGLDQVAELSVEQFTNIPSGSMTPELWLGLARRVRNAFDSIPGLAGVVVTHGTDTMEETAYFLDLVVGDDRPVIVTGAMRNNSRLSSDGAANFYNAARLAGMPETRGRGAMVLLNDVALPAREATKLNTTRLEAFEAPERGPIAVLDPDTVVFIEPRADRPAPLIDPLEVDSLPRVDIVFTYAGADGSMVDAAVAAGAAGIVMASVGRGGVTPGQSDAIERALESGVHVVISSRTMSGRVPVGSDERRLDDWTPGHGVRFGANDLTPQKARVLLMLALARTDRPEDLLQLFRTR
jgi:L-asparaginase